MPGLAAGAAAYYLGSSVFGGLSGPAWALGAWPAVAALALALLAVCGGLMFWLRRIPALAPDARSPAPGRGGPGDGGLASVR